MNRYEEEYENNRLKILMDEIIMRSKKADTLTNLEKYEMEGGLEVLYTLLGKHIISRVESELELNSMKIPSKVVDKKVRENVIKKVIDVLNCVDYQSKNSKKSKELGESVAETLINKLLIQRQVSSNPSDFAKSMFEDSYIAHHYRQLAMIFIAMRELAIDSNM